jgi:porin
MNVAGFRYPRAMTAVKTNALISLIPLALIASASAQTDTFLTRDTLTGDWCGIRNTLQERGIVMEFSTTGYYDGNFSGGTSYDDFEFGGRADAFLHLNTGKLGLWDGGGFHVHAESRFGDSADRPGARSGGFWPVNTGTVLPLGDPGDIAASSIYFTQSFDSGTSLMLGKINAVDLLAADPFFGGWARDRFTNIAFVAPPSGVVPPTIMGGILSQKLDAYSLTLMVFDPDDRTNDYWVDELFENGVNISLSGGWSGKFLERSSSLGITATYSTKEGANLSEVLLPPDLKTGAKKGTYNIALSGSHLLYELNDQPGKGFGIYGKAAIADGNPNPVQSSFVGGFAGHGIVPNRPLDHFGIGYYFYNWSDDLQSATAGAFPIDDEHGVEIYYNLAVTPWFRVSADLQWIHPAKGVFDDAWLGGLRANIMF